VPVLSDFSSILAENRMEALTIVNDPTGLVILYKALAGQMFKFELSRDMDLIVVPSDTKSSPGTPLGRLMHDVT